MAKSAVVLGLDTVQARLLPAFKSRGYRKRGRTFARDLESGVSHIVNLQAGPSEPPGFTPVPHLRESLYGLFTVNVGVFLPEVSTALGDPVPRNVQEYHCQIRGRLGPLSGAHEDYWWDATQPAAASEEVLELLGQHALPLLDQLDSPDQVIMELPALARRPGLNISPWRITLAVLLLNRGEADTAQRLLEEQIASARHHPGHASYVKELSVRLGLTRGDA